MRPTPTRPTVRRERSWTRAPRAAILAFLGGWLFGLLGVTVGGGILGSLIVATVGAVLLLFVAGLFS